MAALSIVVRFAFEGVHRWPDAPQDKPEAYLTLPHRHLFHVEAVKDVSHEERDIEIIAFRREMLQTCIEVYGGPHDFSCETMARALLDQYKLRSCRVMEDNENGAEVRADVKLMVNIDAQKVTDMIVPHLLDHLRDQQ